MSARPQPLRRLSCLLQIHAHYLPDVTSTMNMPPLHDLHNQLNSPQRLPALKQQLRTLRESDLAPSPSPTKPGSSRFCLKCSDSGVSNKLHYLLKTGRRLLGLGYNM
jgi:hypothetical protein